MLRETTYRLVWTFWAWVALGCSTENPAQSAKTTTNVGMVADLVAGPVDSFPRLRFADGLVSLNERCMVRLVALNPKMPPVYVSGWPLGFC